MTDFKSANESYRNGDFAGAIALYRKLLSQRSLPMYRNNLQNCLEELSLADTGIQRQKPHICFITAGLIGPTPGGGIATCFYNMIRACAEAGNADITIVYAAHPYYSKEAFEYWASHFEDNFGARLVPLLTNPKDYGNVEMKRSYAIQRYLMEKDGLFDTVVFHDFMGLGYYSTLTKRFKLGLKNTRVLVSAHGNHQLSYYFGQRVATTWSERAIMFMEREAVKHADLVTTPSVFYAEWINENFGHPDAQCQPNIIYPPAQPVLPKSDVPTNTESDVTPIYFYGRMERLKGIDVLISAIRQLMLETPELDIKLIFAGNAVKIDGMTSQDYINNALSGTDVVIEYMINTTPEGFFSRVRETRGVVVFPTLGETSSCVVVEAILNKAPFLASDIEGIKELVAPEDQSKVLFKTGDVMELTSKIREALNDSFVPKLSFDMDANIADWNRLLTRLPEAGYEPNDTSIPLVSIIVPTKNRHDLLPLTLRSLADQIYPNLEIIVVDDNSADSEANRQIVEGFGARYIQLTQNTYKGAACNFAAEQANGEYICFFDDDDIAYPQMLSTYMHAFSVKPEVDILSCFAEYFDHANFIEKGPQKIDYTSLALGPTLETNILANFFGKGTFIVKKNKFFEVGGYQIDRDTVPMVDYRFYLRAHLKGLNIQVVPFGLYAYRKNSPRSLFYENKDNRKLVFLAKAGIEADIIETLGGKLGRAVSLVPWMLGQPKLDA